LPGPVITVGGPHGTGKSTYARALAEALKLRYVCAGELFRELAKEKKMSLEDFNAFAAKDPTIDRMIDERTKTEAKQGGVVVDAQLAAWMVKDLPTLKLLLTAPDNVRFKRIADRDRTTLAVARKETLTRESIQRHRYNEYYGINTDDLTIYDLKIDTSLYPKEKTKHVIIDSVRKVLNRINEGKPRHQIG
jgi:cytidylate kinase